MGLECGASPWRCGFFNVGTSGQGLEDVRVDVEVGSHGRSTLGCPQTRASIHEARRRRRLELGSLSGFDSMSGFCFKGMYPSSHTRTTLDQFRVASRVRPGSPMSTSQSNPLLGQKHRDTRSRRRSCGCIPDFATRSLAFTPSRSVASVLVWLMLS